MGDSEIALEITRGIRGAIQDLVTPDLKAMLALLSQHSKELEKHSHKLDEMSTNVAQLLAHREGARETLDSIDSRLWELAKSLPQK